MPAESATSARSLLAVASTGALVAGLCVAAAAPAAAVTTDWSFDSPGAYSWTVPDGVSVIEVELWGAAGGGSSPGARGGAGAYVDDLVDVSPGDVVSLHVGGTGDDRSTVNGAPHAGGSNGGGAGGAAGVNGTGGGGGGATDVRLGGTTLADRVVVAGGGGGSSSSAGGAGDSDGQDYSTIYGGAAGTDAGGTGAAGDGSSAGTGSGGDGTEGVGGAGQYDSHCRYTGGGGGGGWFGGGGGGCVDNSGGSGGGGGSSLVSADGYVDVLPNPDADEDGYAAITLLAPDAPDVPDAVAGNGSVTVSWTAPWAGSMDISGYVVTASPGGATCTTSGATTCTVVGLTNGTAYTFTVVATSDVGDSEASPPTSQVVPQGGSSPVVVIPVRGRHLASTLVLRQQGDPAARLVVSTPGVCRPDGPRLVFLRVSGTCAVRVLQAGSPVASGSVRVGASGAGVSLSGSTASFRAGSTWLSPAVRAHLDSLAPTLRRASVVVVTGWTSGTRTTASDLAMSSARAKAVATYLASVGVHVTARTGAGAHWLGTSSASRAAQVSWWLPASPV